MKSKGIYPIYAMFFVACLAVFVLMNESSDEISSQHSDAILISLITAFGVFIVFYDFGKRLPTSELVAPVISFVLINLLAVIAIYAFEVSFSVGIIIPFFMVEGAFVYWLLEKRASAFDE